MLYFGSRLARSIFAKYFDVEHIEWKLLRVFGYANTDVGFRQDMLYENVNISRTIFWTRDYMEPSYFSIPYMEFSKLLMISRQFELNILVVAPSQIWKMRQFRHIKFPKIYLPPPPQPLPSNGEAVMEKFQTLTTAVNLRLSEEVCNIIPNVKKLYLHYDRDLLGYDDSLMECLCSLARLIKLESLKMEINLKAPDHELHKKLAFPSSLRKLSLCRCRLHWNDLSMIGSLPQLQALYLKKRSVTEGKKWSPTNGQFRRLRFLEIDRCGLLEWDADSSHFTVLEKLVLREIRNLEEIPLDIGDIYLHLDSFVRSSAAFPLQFQQ